MEKTVELACIDLAYDKLNTPGVRIMESESPDYLVDRAGDRLFGVEVTEIYPNEGAARIVKIRDYSTQILSKKLYLHKDDAKYLPIQKVRYSSDDNGKEIEFDALVQHLPPFVERVMLLSDTIALKTQKIEIYKCQAREIDLIVYDPTGLFSFSDFTKFFPAFSFRLGRAEIINSKFREVIVLVRKISGKTIRLPLKLNVLVGELIAFQQLISNSRSRLAGGSGQLLYLLAALSVAGFQAMGASIEDGVFAMHCGPWIVRYEKKGWSIINGTLQRPSAKAEPIQEAVCWEKDLNSEERKFVQRLVTRRAKVAACATLIFEFELNEKLDPT